MKKLSLGPGALGAFLVRHGEKLGFAVLVILGLSMVWWGLDAFRSQSVDRNRTPDAIRDLAAKSIQHIDAAKLPASRVPPRTPLAPQIDPWRPQQVKLAEPPASGGLFSRPLIAELTKRTKPDVLPIADLRAVAGIAVLPDLAAEARGAAAMPAARPPELQPAPATEDPRSGRRPARRNPRDTSGETIFGGGELMPPMGSDLMPAGEPLKPGRIAPFIVVTGLVPAAKQRAEFDARFGSVSFRDPRRDVPRWSEYIVERTRVVPGANPRWEELALSNIERAGAEGSRPGVLRGAEGDLANSGPMLAPETLPGGFFLQNDEAEVGYAAALPARIDEPWGTTAVHPWFEPELRKFLAGEAAKPKAEKGNTAGAATLADLKAKPLGLAGQEVRLEAVALEPAPERQRELGLVKFGVRSADGKEVVDIQTIGLTDKLVFATSAEWGSKLSFDLGDRPRACNLMIRVDVIGKTPVARILKVQLLDDSGEVSKTASEPNPDPVAVADEIGLARGFAPAGDGLTPAAALSENRLFRFVDTNVDPGAEYRYRVRFALRNPNVGLAAQHVVDSAITRGDLLHSAYSNETQTVRVPDPTRVLARTIPRDAARKLKIKGEVAEVLVLARSEETGNFALRSTITPVGGLANVDPKLNRPTSVRFFGEPVATERILLDLRGPQEERVDNRSQVPPEPFDMLLLRPGPDGGFEIAAAADSELAINRYRSSLFPPGEDTPDDGKPDPREREAPARGLQ